MRGAFSIILLLLIGVGGCASSGGKAGDTPLVPLPHPPIAGAYPIDIDFTGLPDGSFQGPEDINGVKVTGDNAVVNDGSIQLYGGEVFFDPPGDVSEVSVLVNAQTQSSVIMGLDQQESVVAHLSTWEFGDYYFFTISSSAHDISSVEVWGPDSSVERAIFSRPYYSIEFDGGTSVLMSDSASDALVKDLDGDGNTDIAIVSPSSSAVLVGYGDGAGGLAVIETVPTSAAGGRIISADFNGDTLPDLAATLPGADKVEVFINNGGFFSGGASYPAAVSPSALSAGDVNGDDAVDIAVSGSDGVGILINDGDGTFDSNPYQATSLTAGAVDVKLKDMDLDGNTDMVAAIASPGSVQVWKGDGTGAAGLSLFQTVSLGTQAPVSIDAKTLNWDKYPDVVAALTGTPNFDSWINRKDGALVQSQYFQVGVGSFADLVLGDINADGFDDMAFAGADSGKIDIFVTDLLKQFQVYKTINNGPSIVAVGLGDMDGDHRNDIISVDSFGTAHVFLNRSQ